MPRPPKPHWNEARRRWYANIGPPDAHGRRGEKFAPPELGPRDEAQAWAWMHQTRAELAAAEAPIDGTRLTVSGLAQLYLAWAEARCDEGKVSAAQYENKVYHLRRLVTHCGDRPAARIGPRNIEAFLTTLTREGLSPSYVDNIAATVSAAFNWGVTQGHWAASPIRGFEGVTVPASPERYAERREAAAWLDHLWRRSRPGTMAARYDRLTTLLERCLIRTGARPGEMCCLMWADVKWSGWATSTGHACARAVIPFDRWKTGKATGKARTIYFPAALTRALRREHARPDHHPTHVFIKGHGKGGLGGGQPWPSGKSLAHKVCGVRRELIAIQEGIRKRVKAGETVGEREQRLAGVTILDSGPNRLVNYRWRHTAASSLLMMGVDVPTVAELLGTSPDMIHKTYGHLLSSHLERAAEGLAGGPGGRTR